MSDLHNVGCDFSSSVLLKPPSLSERDAILDAIDTIDWLKKFSPNNVYLEPMHIFPGTQLATQYLEGDYNPPWWLSAAEVLLHSDNLPLKLGGEFNYPEPIAYPRGCKECTSFIRKLFQKAHYLQTQNEFKEISCDCRLQWLEEV